MHYLAQHKSSVRFAGFLAVLLALSVATFAQEPAKEPTKPPPTPKPAAGGRDPFANPYRPKPVTVRKPETPKIALKPTKPAPSIVKPPEIQARINFYKAQKQAALLEQRTPPKPTTAFLIEEIEIAGIFRTPRGYAAMVQAKPIKLSYIIYPGETLYDGQLVAIDDDQVVFRHQLSWTDGRNEVRVERKPLRTAAPPEDALTTEKTTPPAEGAAPANGATTVPATPAPVAPPAAPTPNSEPSLTNVLLNGSEPAEPAKSEPTKPAENSKTKPAKKVTKKAHSAKKA